MFEKAIQLFNDYSKTVDLKETRLVETNSEIAQKLGQLEWFMQTCRSLETQIESSSGDHSEMQAIYEIGLLAEAFYHFSFRLMDVLRKFHPKYKGFYSKSISEVRNHLIVHPEVKKADAKIFSTVSYSVGQGEGPRIKAYNANPGAIQDRGLFINAKEFADDLEFAFK